MTPRLTPHARSRCALMGIGTKQVKRLWTGPYAVDRPASCFWPGRRMRLGDGIAVVYNPVTPPEIITVLWVSEFTREESP